MIKILFFIESLKGGGAEKVLKNLVNAMDTKKFDITVATLYKESVDGELKNGIKYKYCYKTQSAVSNIMMRVEAAAGVAYRLHLKGDYDIEVAYLECGATKIIAGSVNKKAKKIAWVHCDLSKKAENYEAFVNDTKKYYEKYDKIVCVSEDVRNSFIKGYGDKFEPVTLYNCYDDSEILNKSKEPLPEEINKDGKICVAVGRLVKSKGFDKLLKAHKRLLGEGISYKLWILGEGEERGNLEKYIKENNLSDSVTLFGFTKNPYKYIKNADITVCSSEYEGFSTVVVESLILGTPVVTTDCTGMREMLGDSEFGLVTENSEDGIFCGLKKMLTEDSVYSQYKEKAAKRGEAFKIDKAVLKTQSFFEN